MIVAIVVEVEIGCYFLRRSLRAACLVLKNLCMHSKCLVAGKLT